MVKIGINGFGRLGRLLLRVAVNKCKDKTITDAPRVVMINDPNSSPECIGYLLKNDSFYGKSTFDMVEMGSSLMIDGQRVEISREVKIEQIPWAKCQAEYVIDTTGNNITCSKASMYLTQGIKRVIVTGCSNVPMFVTGVNHACFDTEMKTISAASPSMNCLLTMLRVLHENFQVQEAMATALHPYSSSDKILDDSLEGGDCRKSRSATISFSPAESATKRKFIDKIMPELEGKTESIAVRIPAYCVGAIDLTVKFGRDAPYELIKCRLKEASATYMKGILRYSEEDLVSSDIIGDPHSCVIDAKAGVSLSKCFVKVFAWYDAEYGFANRLYDLVSYIASRENCPK